MIFEEIRSKFFKTISGEESYETTAEEDLVLLSHYLFKKSPKLDFNPNSDSSDISPQLAAYVTHTLLFRYFPHYQKDWKNWNKMESERMNRIDTSAD